MVFSNKGWVYPSLAVCPKEEMVMIGCVLSHQARKSWKARLVLREGVGRWGESQQAEPGEYDQEAHTLEI